ncbi:MAG: ABC transporter permease [Acidothermus sp.]|nr:ABC transporter permease [Acidothermus sp.]MCL6538299.1 ABC transporter permease [Acidothermus sp.]
MTTLVHERPPATTAVARRNVRRFVTTWSSQLGITAAFVIVWLVFTVLAPETFLHSRIYVSYAQTVPYFGLTALALTMLIIAGDIDLSFPAVFALGLVGYVGVEHATGNVTLGLLTALAIGALAGLVNGVFVTLFGIPALVLTIGTQFLYRGLTLVLVNGQSYTLTETDGTIAGKVLVGRLLGVPMQFVWFAVLAIVTWILLYRHRLGHNAHVIGDNRQAAALMGIPITRTRIVLFVLTGVAAALAGAMNSFAVFNFYPGQGDGYLLPALAAVFVGGTSVFGGRGTVWGTFIGAFLIGGIEAGIVAVGLKEFYSQLIYGAIITAAITIHAVLQRRLAH